MKTGTRVQIIQLNHDHTYHPTPETEARLTGAVGTVVGRGKQGRIKVLLDKEPQGPVIVWSDELEVVE